MNIQPNHFRWYAAFHDEGKHPHVYMMAWSTVPGEAYLTRDGIRNIKSTLTNQIFKQEMLHTYEQKSQSRDELVREARRAIRQLTQEMTRSICSAPEIEKKMEQLAGQLETVKDKKCYGYLPKSVKKTVDEVVDKLEELPVVRECYDRWCKLQGEVESYYHDKPRERKKLSGRSKTLSSRKRSASVWVRSPSRMMTWLSTTSRNRRVVSPMPGGNCGESFGTRTFLWTTVTGRQRSWNRWQSAATPMRNTGWDNSTGTVLC